MPLYNEILQGRQQNLLTKLFAMVGGSPAPQLAPEIQPSVDLLELQHDTAALQGVRWCRSGENAAAVAAQYSRVGIRNTALVGSNTLLAVRAVEFTVGTTGLVYLQRVVAPALTLSSQSRHQDYRVENAALGQVPLSTGAITFGASASAPGVGIFGIIRAVANEFYRIPLNVVLPPIGTTAAANAYFEVVNGTVNDFIVVNVEWYYRECTQAELTL